MALDSSARPPVRLAVLISGGGTTLVNLHRAIAEGRLAANIALVVSSRGNVAGVDRARALQLPCSVIRRKDFADVASFSDAIFAECRAAAVDLVLCGGFLCLLRIPADFTNRVLNIHPSLIPKFCGQGFHGSHVHEAVLAAGETESGCTVHIVDDEYDHGPIVLQRSVPVLPGDSPETLAARVFEAECTAYPEAVTKMAESLPAR